MRACVCVCLRAQNGGGKVTVCLCACLSGRFLGGGGVVGVFGSRVGGRGRRVDGRTGRVEGKKCEGGERRGRVGCAGGVGGGGSSTHSLTLSVTVWRFHT